MIADMLRHKKLNPVVSRIYYRKKIKYFFGFLLLHNLIWMFQKVLD